MKPKLILATIASIGLGAMAAAGDEMATMPMQPKGDASASSQAFNGAMTKMHQKMEFTYTGNADVDFVHGMMPHHQGAIDMAKVELQYGKDQKLRELAQNIIKAQEDEIAMMREWLKRHSE